MSCRRGVRRLRSPTSCVLLSSMSAPPLAIPKRFCNSRLTPRIPFHLAWRARYGSVVALVPTLSQAITIMDTGDNIADLARSNVVDPYFTRESVGQMVRV